MIPDEQPAPIAAGQAPTLEAQVHSVSRDELLAAASDPALTEDLALALLKRADLPPEVLDELAKNASLLKLRKVRVDLVCHPRAPRHVSVPLVRRFYTFDLVRVALAPTVPADVKLAADGVLIARLKTLTTGERLSLARLASGRVASALVLDSETRVIETALENSRLTEALVIQAVLRPDSGAPLIQAVAHHPKWQSRREVRIALLRTEHVSLGRALEFARGIPPAIVREVLAASKLPARIRNQVLREIQPESKGRG